MSIASDSKRASAAVRPQGRPWLGFRSNGTVHAGIEITDSGVTIAVHSSEDDGHSVRKLAAGHDYWLNQQSLPTGAVVGAEIVQPERVVEAIRAMLATAPVTVDRCAMAIPASAAICRMVALPKGLSEASAEAHMTRSTAELLGQSHTEIAIDFRPLPAESPSSSDALNEDQNWLLLAARLDWVQQRQWLAQRLDVRLERVDWSACALWRALLVTQALENQAPPQAMMLHWDSSGTTLMAVRHGWPMHVEYRPALTLDGLIDWVEARARSQSVLRSGLAAGPFWLMGVDRSAALQEALVERYGGDVQALPMPFDLPTLAACGLAMDIAL